jgi:hypothetical protein
MKAKRKCNCNNFRGGQGSRLYPLTERDQNLLCL